jgi:general secretion pathway protein D
LANQTLLGRGLTTIRTADSASISIVKLSEAAGLARIEPDAFETPATVWDPAAPPVGFVSVVVTLGHADRATVIKAAQPLLSKPGGAVTSLGDGSIVISDVRGRVIQAVGVVRSMDKPAAAAGLEPIPVRNMPAADMVALASSVASKLGETTGQQIAGSLVAAPDGAHVLAIAPAGSLERWRSLIEQLDTREPVVTRTYTVRWHALTDVSDLIRTTILEAPGSVAPDPRQRVAVDALSGSLMVSAPERVHGEIQALLERLDNAPEQTRRPMRTYEIRNRSAQEVLGLLRELLATETGSNAEPPFPPEVELIDPLLRDSMRTPPSTPLYSEASASDRLPGGSSTTMASSGLVMTADDATNTIIAIGEPRQLEHIESILPTLDRRQAQVEFEVLILSLTEGDTLDLGAELEYLTKQQSTTIALASLFGLSSGSNANRTAAGIGGTALILDPGDFAVVIRALETISKGRSLSMPRLLAGNNKPATINSVLQQPFTSTNASDTVATTSFGGTQDAGTNVTITPTIAAGDHLVLDYRISISAFVGESATPGLPPARQQNSVSGSVTIPDGHTIAIGGLRLSTDAKATSQIPLLGDIPVVGEAFKNRSNSGSDSRFYVFIRANVLRHTTFEDLKRLSTTELQDAGLSDGLPVVSPRVIR